MRHVKKLFVLFVALAVAVLTYFVFIGGKDEVLTLFEIAKTQYLTWDFALPVLDIATHMGYCVLCGLVILLPLIGLIVSLIRIGKRNKKTFIDFLSLLAFAVPFIYLSTILISFKFDVKVLEDLILLIAWAVLGVFLVAYEIFALCEIRTIKVLAAKEETKDKNPVIEEPKVDEVVVSEEPKVDEVPEVEEVPEEIPTEEVVEDGLLGKTYTVVDGDNVLKLMVVGVNGKETKPVLIHVITEKGKGYFHSEQDKLGSWHGVGPFDVETGKFIKKEDSRITWSEVISNHLIELTEKNKDLMVITPAMAGGSKLLKYKDLYPDNFIDAGIAEEHALVLANGMSIEGLIPFVSIYSTFLQRGYDQVIHDIARMNTHVIIGIDRAGVVGEDGETHQGIYDVALLNHIPNMVVMAPKDSIEAGNMLYTAFNTEKPFAIRYSRSKTKYLEPKYQKIKIGSWERIKDGKDLTIITYGDFVSNVIEISNKVNLDIEIINARFIKPFDEKMFCEILNSNKKIYIYEEVCYSGSLGEKLLAYAHKNNYKNKIICFSIKDEFILQGKCDIILKELNLDVDYISSFIEKEGI